MQPEYNEQVSQTQAANGQESGDGRPKWERLLARCPEYAKASDLRQAWVDLLGKFHWDLFGTLTFRNDTHPESAFKLFRLFISQLNRKLYGPRWSKHGKGIAWCVAFERQYRGVLHLHCMLSEPELRALLKSSWFRENGRWANALNEQWNALAGFARIEPVKVADLVAGYVSKYVVKGGEIELGGPLMQRRLEQGAFGKIGAPEATVRASAATKRSGLNETSASVSCSPGAGGMRGQRVGGGSPVASHFPSLQAGRASRSGLVEGAHVHGVTGGSGNLPERGSVSAS